MERPAPRRELSSDGERLVILVRPQANLVDRALRSRIAFGVVTDAGRVFDAMFQAPRGCHVVDFADHDSTVGLVRSLAARSEDVVCLSLNEPDLVAVARLNHDLGSPWNSVETVHTCTNKQRLREVTLDVDGLASTRWTLVQNESELDAAGRLLGVPFVLKPCVGAGGRGVTLVRDHEQAVARWSSGDGSPLLAEEYIEGPEYTVETFSVDARHRIEAIVEKAQFPLGSGRFISSRHSLPARIEAGRRVHLEQAARSILDRLGLQQGPSHIQLRVRGPEVHLLEAHCRVSGDDVPEAVWQVTGRDLYELTLEVASGRKSGTGEWPTVAGGACVQYFSARPGHVRRVAGFEVARRAPGVVHAVLDLRVGDRVHPVEWAGDRLGHLTAIGGSAEEAEDRCARALAMVQIETTGSA